MHTADQARRHVVARAALGHLVMFARETGCQRVSPGIGGGDDFAPARTLSP